MYSGSKNLDEICPVTNISYGKLALSPTRTYAPILNKVFQECSKDNINAIIHCGGGQTKVLNFEKTCILLKIIYLKYH